MYTYKILYKNPIQQIRNQSEKNSYKFDTVLYKFLQTGTSDKCLIGIVQLLRFSGFSLYPLSFFLYSPVKHFKNPFNFFNKNLKIKLTFYRLFFTS